MFRSGYHSAIVVFAMIAFAGCGNLTKSPADGLTFTAPAGFTSRFAVMGMMQIWTRDSDPHELMILMRMPAREISNDGFKSTDVEAALKQSNLKNTAVLESKGIEVCGDQPAVFERLSGTSRTATSKTPDEYVEVVVKRSTAGAIVAMYSYPETGRPDPAAEHALREVCPAPVH